MKGIKQADKIHSVWYNDKTELLRDTVHQTSQRESVGWPADSPRDVWWTVSRNYTVLLLSRDVQNTKFNQFLPVVFTSFNVADSRFRKRLMFWMRRHSDIALWRHGGGAWHNNLFLTTASNVDCWADVTNQVTRLWKAGECGKFRTPDTGWLWTVSRSRAAQSGDKILIHGLKRAYSPGRT